MLKEFEKFFNIYVEHNYTEKGKNLDLNTFLAKYQGENFGEGLYRVFQSEEINKWKQIITEAYPEFKDSFEPFAYDWLGRCFAIDTRKTKENLNQILMFEIGTADVLEIPCSLEQFHNEEIPVYGDSCLAITFYNDWKKKSNDILENNKCVGYKIPLFLGGEDVVENLELSDMEVYWFICSAAKSRKCVEEYIR